MYRTYMVLLVYSFGSHHLFIEIQRLHAWYCVADIPVVDSGGGGCRWEDHVQMPDLQQDVHTETQHSRAHREHTPVRTTHLLLRQEVSLAARLESAHGAHRA